MGMIIEFVGYLFVEVVALGTGSLVLLAVTLGTIRLAERPAGLPWYEVGRDAEGRTVASFRVATLVGVLTWVALAMLVIVLKT